MPFDALVSSQKDNSNHQNITPISKSVLLAPHSNHPVIEIATYSETDVYECYIRGFETKIVMRRTKDDWINITQVFKIAQFSKTKRTKILEKESNDMQHEKVQGGYGRFQGTWIPLNSAKFLVNKYEIIDPVVNSILTFKFDPSNPPPKRSKNSILRKTSPGTKITSPSSYNKTPRKKNNNTSTSTSTANKKGKKNAAINQPNPSPLQNLVFQTPQQFQANSSISIMNNNDSNALMNLNNDTRHNLINNITNNNSSQSTIIHQQKTGHENSFSNSYSATQKPLQFFPIPTNLQNKNIIQNNSTGNGRNNYSSNIDNDISNSNNSNSNLIIVPDGPMQSQQQHNEYMTNNFNHPMMDSNTNGNSKKKRKKLNQSNEQQFYNQQERIQRHFKLMKQPLLWQSFQNPDDHHNEYGDNNGNNNNTAVSNGSSIEVFSSNENDNGMNMSSRSMTPFSAGNMSSQTKLENKMTDQEYKQTILTILSSERSSDVDQALLATLYPTPRNFNINFEIDDQGHTPLHWATAMANVPLIKMLITLNANALQCNKLGFNCITKSIFYNNCYKENAFDEIITILKICLITPDANGRFPFHYLIELSVNKSKNPMIIKSYMDSIILSLGQQDYNLLKICLNYQDNIGNTPLHLSALNLNFEVYNRLVYLGASTDILNLDNESPASIMNKFNSTANGTNNNEDAINQKRLQNLPQKSHYQQQQQQQRQQPHSHSRELPQRQNNVKIPKIIKTQHHDIEDSAPDDTLTKPDPEVSESQYLHSNQPNSTNMNTIIDDLSNINSFVTSSVIKSTPSKILENSPILYRRVSQSASNDEENGRNQEDRIEKKIDPLNGAKTTIPLLESPSTLLPIQISPLRKYSKPLSQQIDKLNAKIYTMQRLMGEEIKNLDHETIETESSISNTNKRLLKISHQIEDAFDSVSNKSSINSVSDLQSRIEETSSKLNSRRENFIQSLEKSQALKLATIVQDEESKVDIDHNSRSHLEKNEEPTPTSKSGSSSPNNAKAGTELSNDIQDSCDKNEMLKLATELTLLQFKRRMTTLRISEARSKVNSSTKLDKYRNLIGITIENIDSKIDDIEKDLRANA
ncbi:hypothetical protein SKDZ_05G1910 [Saccharomyces kudriavzevii ZP591]|nr:hypothetical protein SKDZ_05G1910 [Saccharomyces kudriavzevii ZP591]